MIRLTVSIFGCGWLGLPLACCLADLGYSPKGSITTDQNFRLLQEKGITPYLIHCQPSINGAAIKDFFESNILVITLPFKRDLADPVFYKDQVSSILYHAQISSVKFVIFTSSTSIYPNQDGVFIEAQDVKPDNLRSKILREVEQLVLNNKKFSGTIVRCGGLYGPGRMIGHFLRARGKIKGGETSVNLLHLDDGVGIILEIIRQNIRGEIFNAVSDNHPSKRELYLKVALDAGAPLPEFDDSAPVVSRIVSNEKIKEKLNYTFKYPDPLMLDSFIEHEN